MCCRWTCTMVCTSPKSFTKLAAEVISQSQPPLVKNRLGKLVKKVSCNTWRTFGLPGFRPCWGLNQAGRAPSTVNLLTDNTSAANEARGSSTQFTTLPCRLARKNAELADKPGGSARTKASAVVCTAIRAALTKPAPWPACNCAVWLLEHSVISCEKTPGLEGDTANPDTTRTPRLKS